ncbi:MAG: efflux RND transporter permease subunit [Saprospiraceae bacterium]
MKSIIESFVKYKIWANVLIILTFVVGLISLSNVKNTSFPIAPSENVSVQVTYPGAAPEEVEEGVILKIEEAVKGIEGVKEVTSTSRENFGSVNVQILSDYKIDEMVTEVKNAVDRISSFPEGAEKPTVYKVKATDLVGVMLLQGDVNRKKLRQYSNQIEDELLRSELISQVNTLNMPDLEISVEVQEMILRKHQLTFDDVSNAIRRNNTNIAAGSIKSTTEEVLIRADAKKYEAADYENIILKSNVDGSQLRLGEIATIKEQLADVPDRTIYNNNNAIAIQVSKLNEEDLLAITDYLYDYIEDFNDVNKEVELILSIDNSKNLLERRALLLENGGLGLLLVMIVLGLFLSLRLSFWVAFGIPFSFLGMFIIFNMIGGTINLISLFGMIIVIGILVDDGIVIAENVYAHYEKGKSPARATIDGASEILPSVFVSVLTTILVFTVFFSVEGRTGTIMQTIATVVILTLAFSLIEAMLVLPAHLAERKVLESGTEKPKNAFQRFGRSFRNKTEGFINYLRDGIYAPLLRLAIRNRYVAMIIPILFMIVVGSAMAGGKIKFTFFPVIPLDYVQVSLVMPAGTRENITQDKLVDISTRIMKANDIIEKEKGIKNIVKGMRLDVGTSGLAVGGRGGGSETGSQTGSIFVELTDAEKRGDVTDADVTRAISRAVGQVPEAEKFIIGGSSFFGKAVSISLRSTNLEEIKALKTELVAELKTFKNLRDITDSDVVGQREIQIKLKDKAYSLGLTHAEIARQIRQGYFGEEVQRIQKGKDEVRVWVRYTAEDRKSVGQLEGMRIKLANGNEYPLTDLVTYAPDRSTININHLNGAREIRIEGDILDLSVSVPEELGKIEKDVLPTLLEKYPSVSYTFEGQAQRSGDVQSSLKRNFPLIFMVTLLLIALVFKSFSQALLIVPMMLVSVFCAFLGHGIEDVLQGDTVVPVSILSVFGILALLGVIVNDAVIFLDKFNRNIKEGQNIKKAIYEAGIARFRPILLTSLTTVIGLYPIIFEKSFQAAFLKPMAISVAYGVLFGTIFILLSFPAIILVVNDLRRNIAFLLHGYWKTPEQVEPAMRQMMKEKKEKI